MVNVGRLVTTWTNSSEVKSSQHVFTIDYNPPWFVVQRYLGMFFTPVKCRFSAQSSFGNVPRLQRQNVQITSYRTIFKHTEKNQTDLNTDTCCFPYVFHVFSQIFSTDFPRFSIRLHDPWPMWRASPGVLGLVLDLSVAECLAGSPKLRCNPLLQSRSGEWADCEIHQGLINGLIMVGE